MPPAVQVRSAVLSSLIDSAERAWPEECCGILLGRLMEAGIHVTGHHASENVSAEDRTRRYEIDPHLLVPLLLDRREGEERVVGFYHSHPDGSAAPSGYDSESAWPGKVYLIVGVKSGCAHRSAETRGWRFDAHGGVWVEQAVYAID